MKIPARQKEENTAALQMHCYPNTKPNAVKIYCCECSWATVNSENIQILLLDAPVKPLKCVFRDFWKSIKNPLLFPKVPPDHFFNTLLKTLWQQLHPCLLGLVSTNFAHEQFVLFFMADPLKLYQIEWWEAELPSSDLSTDIWRGLNLCLNLGLNLSKLRELP